MSLEGTSVHLVDTLDEAFACKRWLSELRTGKIAFDTETTGLKPEVDRVRLVQISDDRTGWVMPCDMPGSWGALAIELLTNWQGIITTHHGPFDHSMFKSTFGVDLPKHKFRDVRLMRHVLKSTGLLALKPLAAELIDPRAASMQAELDQAINSKGGWTWATVPMTYPPYWQYAGYDPIMTYQLDDLLYPQVMADAPRSYELEMAVAWVTARMERNGVALDLPYTLGLADQMGAYVDQLRDWCLQCFGVSPGQNEKVAEKLIADGVPLGKLTGGGKWQLDKEVLAPIDHPLARGVMEYRRVQKMHGYVKAYPGFVLPDGLVHPSINSVGGTGKNHFEPGGSNGVRTGRMSASDPNVHNVPIRTALGKLIRSCFVTRGPDRTWIKADADQIEMRILAHLSQDPGLLASFGEGDFFVNVSKTLYNDPTFEKSDPRRSLTKNATYSWGYGSGAEKFARTAGVPIEQGIAVRRALAASFPYVTRFIDQVQRIGRERYYADGEPWIRSPLTGRKHVAEPYQIYALTNYCLAPESRVLCADLTWRPIADIDPDDKLIGFDEHQLPGTRNGQLMRTSLAEKTSVVIKPSLRVITDKGTVICSEDHQWLMTGSRHWTGDHPVVQNRSWKRSDALKPGQAIVYFGQPWETDTSYEAGWLAGMYDGEGHLRKQTDTMTSPLLNFAQKSGQVLDRFVDLMRKREIDVNVYPRAADGVRTADIGNRVLIMRALGMLRPTRWQERWPELWEGRSIAGCQRWGIATVLAIEPVGQRELISLQTSTRTFIAEGLFSHNCIQGMAGEILKMKLLEADAAGLGKWMVFPVHDEIDLDVPNEEVPAVIEALHNLSDPRILGSVPITWGVDQGTNWGTAA